MTLYLSFAVLLLVPWVFQKHLSQSLPESELYTRLGWLFILSFLFNHHLELLGQILFYVFLVSGVVDLWYALIFRAYISTSSLEAMFLTNRNETADFFKTYWSWKEFSVILVYVFISIQLLSIPYSKLDIFNSSYSYLLFGVLVIFIFHKTLFKQNFKGVIPGVLGMFPTYLKDKLSGHL